MSMSTDLSQLFSIVFAIIFFFLITILFTQFYALSRPAFTCFGYHGEDKISIKEMTKITAIVLSDLRSKARQTAKVKVKQKGSAKKDIQFPSEAVCGSLQRTLVCGDSEQSIE